MKVITPYSDDVLAYNTDTAQYELTLNYVKGLFGNNFVDDGVLEKRIKKNSRKIYNVIHARINNLNRVAVNFLLSKTQEGRNYIKDILVEQMEADIESGFNDLSSTPAINVSNGQTIDRNLLVQNQISVDAEQILLSSPQYFGFNILYQGQFPNTIYFFVMQNQK